MRKGRVTIGLIMILVLLGMASCSSSKKTDTKPSNTNPPTQEATKTEEPTQSPKETEKPSEKPTDTPQITNTPAPEATPANTDQTQNQGTTGTVSDDWKDMEFIFDGVKYKIPVAYSELVANGWSFNLADYGYPNGYILNPRDTVSSTIDLVNPKYNEQLSCNVGFINNGSAAKDILECDVWAFGLDIAYGTDKLDNVPDMAIAKGIKMGSTAQEVEAAFGTTDDVYESTELGYKVYEYQVDYNLHMKFTIYNDYGVTSIEFQRYNFD